MFAISNAFLYSVEIVQADRWLHGPLELAFVSPVSHGTREDQMRMEVGLHQWNQTYAAGYVRAGDTFDLVTASVPGIRRRKNPNIVLVPRTAAGVTDLHVMLASLLPDLELKNAGLPRMKANMALSLSSRDPLPSDFAAKVEKTFADYIWTKIAPPGRRNQRAFFSEKSPLRLLAGDTRFWMQRIYRIALERRETCFSSTKSEKPWKSLKSFRNALDDSVPPEDRTSFDVRRPLKGGIIWDVEDHEDREAVLDDALTGAGVMESASPIIDLISSHKTHEDFSGHHSWIKEDFERTFYSKRAKLKVDLVETLDDAPVWDVTDSDGYGEVLFRDLFSALDLKERRLVIALRQGKTVCEIASDNQLLGHASISRQVAKLKEKLLKLLH
jgi:hypothetical protein